MFGGVSNFKTIKKTPPPPFLPFPSSQFTITNPSIIFQHAFIPIKPH